MGLDTHVYISMADATYLNTSAEQVHPFIAVVFLSASGLYQDDNGLLTLHTLF